MKYSAADAFIKVRVGDMETRFTRVRDPHGPDTGIGSFAITAEVTALEQDIYVPTSIASGKKPTGFVYQIEGTAVGVIATADIKCKGEGITQVTWGTLLFSKIPKGKTALFRMHIEIRGSVGKTYRIVIGRLHYKRDLNAPRYERFLHEIGTKTLEFK